jgi:phospho-N-acetylmuramoyl-pentapeptide-transferase
MKMLPKDQGRKFAVNGALSEGKPRGAGIIMVTVFVLCSAIFAPFTLETAIYMLLIYAAMLTGFFDDAAEKPWGELKKGLLDLVITVGITANFMAHNSTDILIGGYTVHIPAAVFAILCAVLVWASINVTNCCDGVDGMCATLSLCTILLFILHGTLPADMRIISDIMAMVLLAYLWFNCSPSKILMGDAGSRAIGVFIAVISLKSGNPFLFIFFASVIIVDGGLGLLKLSCRRFLGMKKFMENIRTPIHDHWRKNLGVGDTQVVIRFAIIQLVIGLAAVYLI